MRHLFAALLFLLSSQGYACEWREVTRSISDSWETWDRCGQNGYVWRVTYTLVQRETCTGDLRTDQYTVSECREAGGAGCFDYTQCGSCQSDGMKHCQTYSCTGSPVGSPYRKSCSH